MECAAAESAKNAAEQHETDAAAARQRAEQLENDMRMLMAGVARHRAQHAGQLERLLVELQTPPQLRECS